MPERACPVCAVPLTERGLAGQLVDACDVCQGQYYDAGELEALLDLARMIAAVVLEEREIDLVDTRDRARQLACPGCDAAMAVEELAGQAVDRCPTCGGVWLDGDELALIRLAELHVRTNLGLYIRLGQ